MNLYNFYRSKEWTNLLAVIKNSRINGEGNIICEHCGKPIIKAYDCIGHHKIELTEENVSDYNISLNPDNIALVHHRCHNIIHNKLSYAGRQVFLVYGSPLSGKSTYVSEAMNKGDLILDIDRLWYAVSGLSMYEKPDRLKANVFALRDNLIEQIRYRRGKWSNAYIIGGYPYERDRERLIDSLGAREVFIDTDKDTCIERLLHDTDRDKDVWMKYINEWWEIYNGGY